MEINVKNLTSGMALVKITGRIDIYTTAILKEEMDTLIRTGQRKLIMDFGEVDYIASEGISALIEVKKQVLNISGDLLLFRPTEKVVRTLKFAGVGNYFKIYRKEEEIFKILSIPEEVIKQMGIKKRAGILKVKESPETDLKDVEIFEGDVIYAGRERNNDLCLSHPTVSRRHLVLKVQEGKCFIKDLGSTNGIIINGEKTKETILQKGDKIEIGEYNFIFMD